MAIPALAAINASTIALSACVDVRSSPLISIGPAIAPATNKKAPPLQSPSTVYLLSTMDEDDELALL